MNESSHGGGFRSWIKDQADEYDVSPDWLLMGSKRRDPLYKGTETDHKKARWFANLWEKAVSQREEERIHIRGVHYFVVMAMDEDFGLNADAIGEYIEFDARSLPALSEDEVSPPTSCSWTVYENTERCFDYLKSAATLARILGYVPLDGVYDNKHDQLTVTRYGNHHQRVDVDDIGRVPTGVETPRIPKVESEAGWAFDPDEETPAEYLAGTLAHTLAQEVEFDRPKQAPFHLELWCEKGLPDYIHTVATEMGVNVVVEGEGDLSLTIAHEFAQRVNGAEKPAVVLYLSDFDPKGDQMASAMASKLAYLQQRGILTERVCIEQLAVTQDQVEEFGLPRKPIDAAVANDAGTGAKAYQTLVSEWEEQKGAGATELNTLENFPDLFTEIVRAGCEPYVDPSLSEKNEDAIREWEEQATDALLERFREEDLDGHVDDVEAWFEEFNSRFEDAEEIFEDLHELKREGYLDEWQQVVREAVDDAEVPLAEAPAGEGVFPDDPIYDSDRPYIENVARVHNHERGEK